MNKKLNHLTLIKKAAFAFILCAFYVGLQAQPNTTFSKADMERVRDLSGMKWKFKMMLPGEGVKSQDQNRLYNSQAVSSTHSKSQPHLSLRKSISPRA